MPRPSFSLSTLRKGAKVVEPSLIPEGREGFFENYFE